MIRYLIATLGMTMAFVACKSKSSGEDPGATSKAAIGGDSYTSDPGSSSLKTPDGAQGSSDELGVILPGASTNPQSNQEPDLGVVVSVLLDQAELQEGESTWVHLNLSQALDMPLEISWSIQGTANDDDLVQPPPSVTVEPGETSGTFEIKLSDDTEPEATELLVLKPQYESQPNLSRVQAIKLIIRDNDASRPSQEVLSLSSFDLKLDQGELVSEWPDRSESDRQVTSADTARPYFYQGGEGIPPSLSFDGIDDRLNVESHTELNLGTFTEKSISVLFRTSDDVDSRQMIYEQGGSSRGLSISIHQGKIQFCGWNIPNDDGLVTTPWPVSCVSTVANTYTDYHGVLVYSSMEQKIRAYVNGSLMGEVGGVGKLFAHSGRIGIGAVADNTLFYDSYTGLSNFKGRIFDVALYNWALDSGELLGLFHAIASDYGLKDTSLYFTLSHQEIRENSPEVPQLTISLTEPLARDLLISLIVDGDIGDTQLRSGQFVFPAFETEMKIPVPIIDDSEEELQELVTVSLNSEVPILSGPQSLMILDDDSYYPKGNAVLWLRGDRSQTTVWDDVFGVWQAKSFSDSGVPQWAAQGLQGQAAWVFDGVDDGLTIPDAASFNTSTTTLNKSIAVVFQVANDVITRQVIFEQGGGQRGTNIYLENGNLNVSMWNLPQDQGDGSWGPKRLSTAVSEDSQYTVLLVYNGMAREFEAFVNGVSIGVAEDIGTLYSHSGDLGIGAMKEGSYFASGAENGNGHYFNGVIAELIYWNQSIDDTERGDMEEYFTRRYREQRPL
ncbi:hypothetical protein [Pseudobacteriovorax antillogorgiicola]|uniref:Concanavalin A-like lectin/glucanases superfamily protein n=1 Tax=Pseudobacteriovorax antillogorgiicola TaxID=1513793 RepID=A0A1Y6CP24_9BACT|nr:hypothetical protein [Pseudobacteriovorax antillogorgiicola]TCS47333.1 concanavalin A-like lectin/glucanase superfamily protein [Pseudobacteriovorax antillogorgiicola]SMF63071.1 Concanavalin A-like lectin/glucanases superfamily protein [Pseudobacteriovorax antillogorgiicola]